MVVDCPGPRESVGPDAADVLPGAVRRWRGVSGVYPAPAGLMCTHTVEQDTSEQECVDMISLLWQTSIPSLKCLIGAIEDTNSVMYWTLAIRTKTVSPTERWIHALSAIIRDVNGRIRISISQRMDNLEAEWPLHNTVFIKTPVQSIYGSCLRKIRERRYQIMYV